MLSEAIQNYLKIIYELQSAHGPVSTSAVAERMEVAAASATAMLKRLAGMKLLRHSPYQGVTLTRAGERIALEVVRHHRLLELYLAQVLGYSWDMVHDEAERLEHAISEEFEERIDAQLGRPSRDPHGDPIPSKEGVMEDPDRQRLADMAPGAIGVVRRVSDRDAEMLRYLAALGLTPDVAFEVVDKAPFDGPLTLRIGAVERVVGREVARSVFVSPAVSSAVE